jgi:hypothetical protein
LLKLSNELLVELFLGGYKGSNSAFQIIADNIVSSCISGVGHIGVLNKRWSRINIVVIILKSIVYNFHSFLFLCPSFISSTHFSPALKLLLTFALFLV